LLPFQRLLVGVGRLTKTEDGQGTEVQNLRGAEWAGGTAMLTGAALFNGFYLNELLMKFIARQDPYPALFDAYTQTLSLLSQADDQHAQAALRAFEMTLLREVGLLPELDHETLTLEEVQEDARYALLPEAGVASAREGDASLTGTCLIGMKAALMHGSMAALQQVCAPALPELKATLRTLLHYHLGSPVLRTRQVMLEVQNLES
jgi:DNA repair protein RecO (recombination protein O)